MYFPLQALSKIWQRDGKGISDCHLDAIRHMANAKFDGGIQFVLTGHSHQVPVLSHHFDTTGAPVTHGDQLRLSHSPCVPYEGEHLGHSVCGNVADPLLDQISVKEEFGEYAKLILDRMPLRNQSSFVGFVQVETAFQRSKMEGCIASLARHQPNFIRGGVGHEHDGFSCFFGKHHQMRSFVGDYRSRPDGNINAKVSMHCKLYCYIYFMQIVQLISFYLLRYFYRIKNGLKMHLTMQLTVVCGRSGLCHIANTTHLVVIELRAGGIVPLAGHSCHYFLMTSMSQRIVAYKCP